MVLTKQIKETVSKRIREDTQFRRALLAEVIELLLAGDGAAGRAMLEDVVTATIGFETLACRLGKESKSIHWMLGQNRPGLIRPRIR